MIGKGKAVKEIAGELHLSSNTVRTYRTRILEKIGVKGTSELIHYALTHSLGKSKSLSVNHREIPQ